MLMKKDMPDENEIVMIRIEKITRYGAYCKLLEYDLDSFLPIEEVSSGWVKNIHEFIKEGEINVAKVIHVDKSKMAVDISLKRVGKNEKKEKIEEYTKEVRYKKLFEQAIELAKANKDEIINKLSEKYNTYIDLVNAIYNDKEDLSFLDNEKAEEIIKVIKKSIKPKVFKVSYIAEITTNDTMRGIEAIKEALNDIINKGINVIYSGAPHYLFIAKGESYPEAESKIKEAINTLSKNKTINFSIKKVEK